MTNSILEKIKELKLQNIQSTKRKSQIQALQNDRNSEIRSFNQTLLLSRPSIIAEIKKTVLDKSICCGHFNVCEIVQTYKISVARCLSILTETYFFKDILKIYKLPSQAVISLYYAKTSFAQKILDKPSNP